MKKVVSLLLVVVLALGMSTMAFATTYKVTKIDTTKSLSLTDDLSTTRPGQKVYVNIPNGYFLVDVAGVDTATAAVTKQDMSKGKAVLKVKVSKGSNLVKKYEMDYPTPAKTGRIKVEFIKPFVSNSTDGTDFDFTIYFSIDGTRYEDQGANFVGTLINESTSDIDADTDYINLEGGRITEATEYCKSLEYYLGEGISIFGKAFKDKKYYGYVTTDVTDAQAVIMDQYGIDQAFNISQVGLDKITTKVVFNDADADYYVYDGDLNYLGQVKDANFAFASTYYLAAKKLDVDAPADDEPEDEELEEDVPEAPPVTGGIEENTNENPGTGF